MKVFQRRRRKPFNILVIALVLIVKSESICPLKLLPIRGLPRGNIIPLHGLQRYLYLTMETERSIVRSETLFIRTNHFPHSTFTAIWPVKTVFYVCLPVRGGKCLPLCAPFRCQPIRCRFFRIERGITSGFRFITSKFCLFLGKKVSTENKCKITVINSQSFH